MSAPGVPDTEPGPILAPVSAGELVDKITILEIKAERIRDPDKRANVIRELDALRAVRDAHGLARFADFAAQLRAVNEELWAVEDDLRAREQAQCFDGGFVALARQVYLTNDRRAAIKRALNMAASSPLVEEKAYGPEAR